MRSWQPNTAQTKAATSAEMPERSLLQLIGISRAFGETRALQSASLNVNIGEIHALAGENGSGKSTLLKILSGVIAPDAGEICWSGRSASFGRPSAAQAAGISTVFQDTLVVPELSVKENIFFGTDGMFRHRHSAPTKRDRAQAILAELGFSGIDVDQSVWTLTLAERQIVTIARAAVRPWKLLLLDEATSALDAHDRDELFRYLRASREMGKSILFTSHRMSEIEMLADSVTVLRAGKSIVTLPMSQTSPRELLTLMAGERLAKRVPSAGNRSAAGHLRIAQGTPPPLVLRVAEVSLRRRARAISLEVHQGEILGLCGLEGQGQAEFAQCIGGTRHPVSGSIYSRDEAGTWQLVRGARHIKRNGVAYVPRDRKQEGLFLPMSIVDNMMISLHENLNFLGLLRRGELRRRFDEYARLVRLVSGPLTHPVDSLSGGNQQKVLLGRWLATRPRLLVLNDPLRGVDANTKDELYPLFRQLADEGLTIVFLSTELVELLALCDRIAVFHDGSLEKLLRADKTTEIDLMAAMFGGAKGESDDARNNGA